MMMDVDERKKVCCSLAIVYRSCGNIKLAGLTTHQPASSSIGMRGKLFCVTLINDTFFTSQPEQIHHLSRFKHCMMEILKLFVNGNEQLLAKNRNSLSKASPFAAEV